MPSLWGELLLKGFVQSKNDYSLFIKHTQGHITILAVYVDDIIIIRDDLNVIQDIEAHLDHVFSIKDLGKLSFFLGIETGYVHNGICLTRKKFTKELLATTGLQATKDVATPLPINLKLSAEGALYEDPSKYRCFIGKLNFITHTRCGLYSATS